MIDVKGIKKYFSVTHGFLRQKSGHVKAVDGVSFTIAPGKTLGLVGESACGKTTVGKIILGLLKADEGKVLIDGKDITVLSESAIRPLRPKMQPVFQDPFSSLNPRMKVGDIITEGIRIMGGSYSPDKAGELLKSVGLTKEAISRFPHQFSGGQRQRIGIARAIATNPSFLVCDEPVSSLDVSIQAQILNLLKRLQNELNFACLFIAHDLSVVEHMSDDVAVMYLGKIVEKAPKEELYKNPLHPYTRLLLASVPVPDPIRARRRRQEPKKLFIQAQAPGGCRFSDRCPGAMPKCALGEPALKEVSPGHHVACYL